jgi:hypothetical protein
MDTVIIYTEKNEKLGLGPGRGPRLFSSPKHLDMPWGPPSLHSIEYRGFFYRAKAARE